ncbi:right-handed parallel beta-helix repeat-containing protein [Roseburia sp.]|jgi:hypothetical protein|uniref:right-handed parallel beta-helix repeat-containing protein n=1 Tax=Roseburia sp. TaxID=2049040 RepID=UPI00352180F5
MKYQKALLCIALAGTLIFSGCGSTNNSTDTDNTTSTSSSVESTVEASTEDTDTKSDENTIMGMISEITDSTITVATMPGGGQGEAPGNPPSDNNGSDNNSAPADKPDSDGTDSTETPDNQPSGDNTSAPSDNGGTPDMGNMSTETINLTDSTVYYDKDGNETTLSALSEGTMVTITFDDDGNAATVTISDGGNAPGGGAPGGSASSQPESYNAVTEYTEDTEVSDASFSSTGSDENAILVSNGANVTLKNITLDRTSSDSTGGDSSSFYGVGAGLLATDGTVSVDNATITTDSAGGAGIFSYGNGNVTVSDSTITTTQDTSGGIHVAGGGTLTAKNLTVTTNGESSAAIRSDRGGGTMTVDGGSYTSNGTGSPAVYCTADISISNASLTANGSEAVCIEGLNSLKLTDCDLTGNIPENEQNDCNWTVILYQSMSGDSEVGNSNFSMTGGSLTSENGGMFYTTNTESTFYLSGVDLNYSDSNDFLLKCTGNSNARGWGSSGANGADCEFTADSQTMAGKIIWDSISQLDVSLKNKSTWTGSFVQDESNAGNGGDGYANLTIDSSSTWIVDGDSTLSSLTCKGTITDADGNTVTVKGSDGTTYVEGTSDYTITISSYEA